MPLYSVTSLLICSNVEDNIRHLIVVHVGTGYQPNFISRENSTSRRQPPGCPNWIHLLERSFSPHPGNPLHPLSRLGCHVDSYASMRPIPFLTSAFKQYLHISTTCGVWRLNLSKWEQLYSKAVMELDGITVNSHLAHARCNTVVRSLLWHRLLPPIYLPRTTVNVWANTVFEPNSDTQCSAVEFSLYQWKKLSICKRKHAQRKAASEVDSPCFKKTRSHIILLVYF